jgi:16S rRNA (cytidine1402-2'-O)-methyltransferase
MQDLRPAIEAAAGAEPIVPETGGTLYIVATPIGNLEDMSPRARRILDEVDVILCEDTRHTGQMLQRLGIGTRRLSLHEHNEARRVREVIDGLLAGRNYALVSDAGTPLISDPGFRLVQASREASIAVSPVPGPCAAIAALSAAGLPSDRFCFEGFLPARAAARRARLETLAGETRTLIIYESARRICATLRDSIPVFGGDRPAAVARELTKAFESIYRDSLSGLAVRLEGDPNAVKGECVLVIAGATRIDVSGPDQRQTLRVLLEVLPASTAARVVARLYGVPRREAYDMALGMADD